MMYPYITFTDETEVTHSQIIEGDSGKTVVVHFERPTDTGFDSARCILPTYEWVISDGYSAEEIEIFTDFLRRNAHLIFRFAETGGISCA